MHALLLVLALVAPSQTSVVDVEGRAKRSPDRAVSIEAAKRDARARAQERALGLVVSSTTVVRNFAVVRDVVLEELRGVVVEEAWGLVRDDGDDVVVALHARVDPGAGPEAVCAVLRARKPRKVAVVVMDGRKEPAWAAPLLAQLGSGCMATELLAPGVVVAEGQTTLVNLRTKKGVDLALLVRGDVEVTARLVDLSTNEVVATASGAVPDVADALFQQVARAWIKEASTGRRVSFRARVSSFTASRALAEAIATKLDVAVPADLRFQSGEASFSLRVPGDGDVGPQLDGVKVGKRRVRVVIALDGVVDLSLVDASDRTTGPATSRH